MDMGQSRDPYIHTDSCFTVSAFVCLISQLCFIHLSTTLHPSCQARQQPCMHSNAHFHSAEAPAYKVSKCSVGRLKACVGPSKRGRAWPSPAHRPRGTIRRPNSTCHILPICRSAQWALRLVGSLIITPVCLALLCHWIWATEELWAALTPVHFCMGAGQIPNIPCMVVTATPSFWPS